MSDKLKKAFGNVEAGLDQQNQEAKRRFRNLLGGGSPSQVSTMPVEQAPQQMRQPSSAYDTAYPSDEKFEAARKMAVERNRRAPNAEAMSQLQELRNKLAMEESEAEFDGPTPQSQAEMERIRALIYKLENQ